jgi:hypothetical protein
MPKIDKKTNLETDRFEEQVHEGWTATWPGKPA